MLRVENEQTFRFEQPALAALQTAPIPANPVRSMPPTLKTVVKPALKVLSATLASTTEPDWTAPEGKANNMVVYGTVAIDGKDVDAAGSRLAAFEGNQIAGFVEIQDGPNGKYFPLQILTDSTDGSTITFKVYDATTGKTVDLKETVPFQAEGVVAAIDAPKLFIYTMPSPSPSPSPSPTSGNNDHLKPATTTASSSSSAGWWCSIWRRWLSPSPKIKKRWR